jgi:hypothetical protein
MMKRSLKPAATRALLHVTREAVARHVEISAAHDARCALEGVDDVALDEFRP